jgi:hypothetical protein
MRRFSSMGLALVAALAMSGLATSVASAKPPVLEITELGEPGALGPLATESVGLELSFVSNSGTVTCTEGAEGHLTSNSAKKDTFTNETGNMRCVGGGSEGETSPGLSTISFKPNGAARLGGLTLAVRWPAFKACTYSRGILNGTNTVSELLEAHFSGTLRGHNCPEKTIKVMPSGFEWTSFGPHAEPLAAEVH